MTKRRILPIQALGRWFRARATLVFDDASGPPRGDRGLLGIMVLFAMIALAAIYLLIGSQLFGALDSSPITQDPSFSDSDALINGTPVWERSKDIALIYVPLILVANGMVFAVGYYIRRERAGGRRPPP